MFHPIHTGLVSFFPLSGIQFTSLSWVYPNCRHLPNGLILTVLYEIVWELSHNRFDLHLCHTFPPIVNVVFGFASCLPNLSTNYDGVEEAQTIDPILRRWAYVNVGSRCGILQVLYLRKANFFQHCHFIHSVTNEPKLARIHFLLLMILVFLTLLLHFAR